MTIDPLNGVFAKNIHFTDTLFVNSVSEQLVACKRTSITFRQKITRVIERIFSEPFIRGPGVNETIGPRPRSQKRVSTKESTSKKDSDTKKLSANERRNKKKRSHSCLPKAPGCIQPRFAHSCISASKKSTRAAAAASIEPEL